MSDLERLAKPFPAELIHQPPQGKYGAYVEHGTVVQKLLAGGRSFDFEVIEIVRGEGGKVEGCLARLTIDIDGRRTTIVEPGDCEQPDNWKTEGARLKDAASDALKRCAMRIGVGLHLWGKDDYFLHRQLVAAATRQGGPQQNETRPPPAPLAATVPKDGGVAAAFSSEPM